MKESIKKEIQVYIDNGSDISSEAEDVLYETFYKEMPYGTAKCRTGDPEDWYGEHLNEIQNWLEEQ
jgi:hypothetical protein